MSAERELTDEERADKDSSEFQARYSKPSDLVAAMHSHDIWDAAVLDRCDFDTSTVPTFTEAETAASMARRGLGGELVPGDQKRIYGWTTAEALCEKFLGYDPSGHLSGRGSIHRTCLAALVMDGK